MNIGENMIYAFESFEVDVAAYELRKAGLIQNIEKQVFDLLLLLVANPDRVITKDEIIETVWGGRVISDAAVNSRISTLRSALDDSGREQRLIKTIHNQGLRFVGTVVEAKPSPETTPVISMDKPAEVALPTIRLPKKPKIILPLLSGIVIGAALFAAAIRLSPNINIIDTNTHIPWEQNYATDSYEARDAYMRGVELRDKSNSLAFSLAADQFQIAIDKDPEFAAAYAALASVNARIYENDPAANLLLRDRIDQTLAQAKALSPKSKEVLLAEGEIAALRNDYAQAMMLSDAIIEENKYYLPAYLLQSTALQKLGRKQDAAETLSVALSMDPLSPQILQAMSEVKIANKDYAGSLEAASANIWWNPESTKSLLSMARIEKNNAQYERAFDYLERAKTLNPVESAVAYDLIDLYNNLGMTPEKTIAAHSKVQQALIVSMVGKRDEAGILLSGLEIDDAHINTHYFLRDYESAEKRFNIYLSGRSELDIQPRQGLHYARMCFVFKRSRSPMQDRICSNVDQYYKDKSPDDFLLYEDILGGAALHLIVGDTENARFWLDYLVEKGHTFLNLTSEPVFSEFETVEGYEALKAQMVKNAKLHRTHIRSKLAK